MALPDLILNNFRWKAGALTMAVFIWFLIQFAISKGYRPRENPLTDSLDQIFSDQPVLILAAADDKRIFKVTPAKVDVTVRATTQALNRLTKHDIKAFVDLVDATNAVSEVREVFVRTPAGIDVSNVKVKPPYVTVERGGAAP